MGKYYDQFSFIMVTAEIFDFRKHSLLLLINIFIVSTIHGVLY